ncbi:TAPT1, partial [Symbiodinium microadriaticum]
MATAALGESSFQGRGRSPPRAPAKDVPGNLPRPCGLSDAIFEDGSGRCDGSKSPLYLSINSNFVLPTADDLAGFASTRSPGRRPAWVSNGQFAQATLACLDSDREGPFSSGDGESSFGLPAVVSPRSSLGPGARTRAQSPNPRGSRHGSETLSEIEPRMVRRGSSEPRPGELPDVGCQARVHDVCTAAAAATVAAKSVAAAVERSSCLMSLAIICWRWRRKLLLLGFLLCLDILLHELSFTPLQAVRSCTQLMLGLRQWGCWDHRGGIQDRPPAALLNHGSKNVMLNITEQGDCIRFSLLILNVTLMLLLFDVAWMYHYIEGESFLKLYVLFNMLEMFERWCRSVGVDLFDLLLASIRHPWYSLLSKYGATLLYCFVHATIHLVRVILLNVAINTSSNAVYLIIVTNNFAEIKSTVFKRYEEKSLFPIIASDIVERFYVMLDIIFVIARLSVSEPSGKFTAVDISFWLLLLVVLEIGTDWIKFCLITKFSEMQAKTFEVYWEVLLADILLCRCGNLRNSQVVGSGEDLLLKVGRDNLIGLPTGCAAQNSVLYVRACDIAATFVCMRIPVDMRMVSTSLHVPSLLTLEQLGGDATKGFQDDTTDESDTGLEETGREVFPFLQTTIVALHLVMLANAPCTAAAQYPRIAVMVFVVGFFLVCILSSLALQGSSKLCRVD